VFDDVEDAHVWARFPALKMPRSGGWPVIAVVTAGRLLAPTLST
jgi:hypothetical protein